jgi:hypothetical protein
MPSFSFEGGEGLTGAAATSPGIITGYAWSDTIGWISINGSNYGLNVRSNGTISGYAWSDNIGWISANASDLSGCPTSLCTATLSHGVLNGWLKALAGGSAQSGGWDGWISLKGSGYGPTVTNGNFSGYAWGSDVIGWIDFSQVQTTFDDSCPVSTVYSCPAGAQGVIRKTVTNADCSTIVTDSASSCAAPTFCSPGAPTCLDPTPQFNSSGSGQNAYTGHLQAHPLVVPKGNTTKLYWSVSNVNGCSVSGGGQTWNGLSSPSGGQVTNPINQQTIYTLTCTKIDSTTFSESVTIQRRAGVSGEINP